MSAVFTQEKFRGGIAADDKYWEALADGEFRLCRCAQCGTWMVPAHYRCGACGSWEQVWPLVEPLGTIYSWTRTRMAFPRTEARADDVPFVTALVEVDGTDGARIFGIVVDTGTAPHIGDRVRGEIRPGTEKSFGYPTIEWQLVDAPTPAPGAGSTEGARA
ncbi:hypothetical protein GCM10022261_01680 [Brevibacterium daeguense]|uniref:DNA-binding protein n=1 Tax=Brevibacterium daeguense TaxID=909936 RepID=A0ABP8EF89_9MICO|nr:OB-fold domain-containing protein [Brevibacterium daeguense]